MDLLAYGLSVILGLLLWAIWDWEREKRDRGV